MVSKGGGIKPKDRQSSPKARRPSKVEECADKPTLKQYNLRPVTGFGRAMLATMRRPGDRTLPKVTKMKAVKFGDTREALGASERFTEG